jgi:hypothetical protein
MISVTDLAPNFAPQGIRDRTEESQASRLLIDKIIDVCRIGHRWTSTESGDWARWGRDELRLSISMWSRLELGLPTG